MTYRTILEFEGTAAIEDVIGEGAVPATDHPPDRIPIDIAPRRGASSALDRGALTRAVPPAGFSTLSGDREAVKCSDPRDPSNPAGWWLIGGAHSVCTLYGVLAPLRAVPRTRLLQPGSADRYVA